MYARIHLPNVVLIALALAVACLAACSRQTSPTDAAAQTTQIGPKQSQADLTKPQTACWLLPGDVVSTVLDESLTPVADLGAIQYGNTTCNYYAPGSNPEDDAPRLTLTLDWNGYNIIAMDIPKAGPATAATPYADIGDGALFDHGILWVRAGEHSLALDLRGDGSLHDIAGRLITAARPRLGK